MELVEIKLARGDMTPVLFVPVIVGHTYLDAMQIMLDERIYICNPNEG